MLENSGNVKGDGKGGLAFAFCIPCPVQDELSSLCCYRPWNPSLFLYMCFCCQCLDQYVEMMLRLSSRQSFEEDYSDWNWEYVCMHTHTFVCVHASVTHMCMYKMFLDNKQQIKLWLPLCFKEKYFYLLSKYILFLLQTSCCMWIQWSVNVKVLVQARKRCVCMKFCSENKQNHANHIYLH